ncbi:HYR domain-containing protein [Draconibacterium sp. IB214405]|uniref:HYR domain-containing protein n=1 Tax=Draconibacterium sp. IB214405 TaxID=3097352 RepID=UPI002A16F58C|nr:HYR domain-containing protein [Draconibacterium sp. IB214405]MDX8337604.1 HYR domain-containing protein [Draconibacterium sp. IB214405]
MTKSKHNQNFKTVLLLLAVLLCFTEVDAVRGEEYASLTPAKNSVWGNVSTQTSNHLLSSISDKNVIQDDTTGISCLEDITTYTDLNSCVAVISTGLDLDDPKKLISSLSWEMTGATEASANGSGINQIGSYSFNEGTTVITYSGATLYNNSIFCTFTVTVSDNQVPRLENPQEDIIVRSDAGDCYAFVSWAKPIVSDNCASPSQILVTGSHEPGTSFPVGTTVVSYSINDGIEYNDVEHSFTVTVVDEELPEIFAPQAVTVNCGETIPDAFTTWQQFTDAGGMAFDNCNIDFSSFKYEGQKSSGIRCPYTITRTYSVADGEGNIAEVAHSIYVGEEVGEEEQETPVVLKSAMTVCTAITGNWNDASTWSCGVIPSSTDSVVIPNGVTVTIDAAAECSNILIETGGELNHGSDLATTLQVYGDWTNNGTYDSGNNGVIEFTGSSNTTVGGSSITVFKEFTLNKTTSSNTLTLTGDIQIYQTTSSDVQLTSGTLVIGTGTSVDFTGNAGFTIGTNAEIFVNGGAFKTGNYTVANNGTFRIDDGTANFGTNTGNSFDVNSTGTFEMNGGTVDVAGRLVVSGGTFNITDGTLNLNTVGHNSGSEAVLDLSPEADFNMTGGVINFLNPSTAGFYDVNIEDGSGTKTISGGSFNFGDGSSSDAFRMASEIGFPDYTIANNASLSLIVPISANGTYTFPLDDGSGGTILVTIVLTSYSPSTYPFIEVKTFDEIHPQNANTSNYLDRYWTVVFNDISGPSYSISAEYLSGDIANSATDLIVGNYNSSWSEISGATVSGNTVSFTSSLTDLSFTVLEEPTVTISNTDPEVICDGGSVTLNTTANGASTLTYSWSPATYLNNASSSTPVATPPASPSDQITYYTYEVTVTDANNISVSDTIDITVNPLPTVTAPSDVCVNENETLSPTTGGTWVSSNDAIATVTNGGIITGVSSGSVTFTFTETATGCSKTTSTVTVNPQPAATITGNNSDICFGDDAEFYLSGTADARVYYKINSGSSQYADLDGSGLATVSVSGVTTNQTISLDSVVNSITGCSKTISETSTVTVNSKPSMTSSNTVTICSEEAVNLTLNSDLSSTYTWIAASDNPDVFGESLNEQTGSTITDNLTISTTSYDVQTITYYVIPTSDVGSCAGDTQTVIVTVNPIISPYVQITIDGSASICEGELATFTSVVDDTSTYNASYQWKINGTAVSGATGSTFSSTSLQNGDEVTLDVWTSTAPCYETSTAYGYTMTVNPTVVPYINILESDNEICAGTEVSFISEPHEEGSNPSYQWQISNDNSNWTDYSGANSSTFAIDTLTSGPRYFRILLTSSAQCASPVDTVSPSVEINVNPVLDPSVTITSNPDTAVCPGTIIQFTATATNQGNNPSYQWKLNGSNVGSNLPTYSSATLVDGDEVWVVLTSNIDCPVNNPVNSDTINVLVKPGTPSIPGTIDGDIQVCADDTLMYTIAPVTDATSYNWSVSGTNWNIISGDGSDTVYIATGDPETNAVISVTAENDCGVSAAQSLAVAVYSISEPATGINVTNNNTCFGTAKILAVSGGALGKNASWNWYTDDCGTSPAGTGTTITVDPPAGDTVTYYVRAEGLCNTTECVSVDVIVNPATPPVPGAITGNTTVCPGETETYYINSVEDANSYAWSIPGGWAIVSGQGDTLITVITGEAGQNGNVSVTAKNDCGTSVASTLAVTVDPGQPADPGPISGTEVLCSGSSDTYSIDAITDATKYNWGVPSDWSIAGIDTTNSVTVVAGTGDGYIYVTAENSCGETDTSWLWVSAENALTLSAPDTIVGEYTAICPPQSSYYFTNTVSGADGYIWTVPDGWNIRSGQGSEMIDVDVEGGASSGYVTVSAYNVCDTSVAYSLHVSVDSTGIIEAGPDQYVCEDIVQVYMQGSIGGAIDSKQDWDWESVNYPETNKIHYFDDPDSPTSLFDFPEGLVAGDSIVIRMYSANTVGGCGVLSDTMKIFIIAYPDATIAPDTVCEGESATLTITATPNTRVTYVVGFDDQGTVDVGEDGTATIVTGPITENTTYELMRIGYIPGTYGTETCIYSIFEAAEIVVNYLPTVEAGDDRIICSNNSEIQLDGSVTGSVTTGYWSGGAGTYSTDSTDLTAIYTPTQEEIDAGFLSLILTSTETGGPCEKVSDQVDFTFDQAPIVNAGLDDTICSNNIALLAGSFGGSATSASWSSSGDGTFDDNTKTTAVYTPGVADSTAGWVYLIYTTNNPGTSCGAIADTLTLTIEPAAYVDAGEEQTICASSTVILSGSIGGSTTSATWSGGTGTFSDVTDLLAEYTPSAADTAAGSVTLTLNSDDPAGICGTVSDQVIITINPEVVVEAGIPQQICYGSSIVLEGTISGAVSSGIWTNGSGTFSDATDLGATFTPSVSDTTILLILTSDDPGTECGVVSDTMELRIDPEPYIYAGSDTMICEDGIAQLNGAVEAGYSGTWTTNGAGTFSSSTSPTATYIPGSGDVYNETVIIVYTTNEVSGECGVVSDTMILTVKETIEITTQPKNTGVCALHDTSIFVNVVGDDLSYQWYYADGTAVSDNAFISGAQTAALNFHDATSTYEGGYYVEISSPTACGSATSDTVTLNVDQEIEVITPLSSDTVCVGDNLTFSILAEPGGELAFQWYKGINPITDSTRNELVLNNVSMADAGSYSVYISGMQGYTCEGQTSTSGELVVIEDATITPIDAERIFCMNISDVSIKYSIDGGADDVSVPSVDLPPGLTGSFNADSMEYEISGIPTASGEFIFTVSTSGFCVQDQYEDTIIINPELTAAVITIDNPDICYNEVPDPVYIATMPQGGSEPYSYQWQDSTAGSSWADYTGTGTSTSIDPPALTDTTYYRIIITDNGIPSCGSVTSNVVAVYPFDDTPPTFTVPTDKQREAGENCIAFVDSVSTGSPSNLYDNCTDIADLIISHFDHDTAVVGCNFSFMRTWRVVDEAGNVALDTQLITVVDNTPPVIASRAVNRVIDCGVSTHPDDLGWSIFTDNCDDDVTVTYYDEAFPGSCAGDSTIYRYWIGTDDCGNADTASTATVITISDISPPVVYDEQDMRIDCVSDLPEGWQIPAFGIADACSDSFTIELVDEYAWGIDDVSGYCPYKVDRTWRVRDECGNDTTFVQNIIITQADTCAACKECLYDNTYNWADLTGDADSTITFYNVVKRDKCCGAENQPGGDNLYCASFNIKIDPYAIGVEIITSDVTPPGQSWKVDCEDVDGGEVVCIEPGRFHLFTFCKHAESDEPQNNDYTFRSISGLLEGGDIETREECDRLLEVEGTFESVTWTSVYPGNPGDYDHLLTHIDAADTIVYFNAEPGSPSHIQYQVCGQLSQSLCFTDVDGWICDTLDVYVHEAISLDLNVNPDLICEDSVPTITPTIYPAGTYSLEWYSGPNATGTYLGTGSSFIPENTGTYSVVVTDLVYNFGCNTDTINFPMSYDYTGPTIKNTPPTLYLSCNDPDYDDIIYEWLESPYAEYVNADGDTVEAQVNYDYYKAEGDGPVTMICGDTVRVQFTAMDQCSNDTIEYSYIVVIDTTLPVLTPAIDSIIQCSTTDPDQDPGFLSWLANHGGATASDLCDPDLEWSADTALTDWTWDPANNERTVTFYVMDDCGNIDSTTATFSIVDTVPPVLHCPGDFADEIGADSCSLTGLTMDTVWAEDDCSVPELNWTIVRPDGTSYTGTGQVINETFDIGISYVYYEAVDAASLVDTCSFTVWIKHLDIDPIAYDCPNEDLVETYADATNCDAYVDLDTVSIYDPCDEIDSVWNNSPADGATPTNADGYYEVGLTTFYWYIHTTSQTLDSCEVNVYVIDTTKPVFIECPLDAVDSLINNDCDKISDEVTDPVIGGDCSPLILTYELILPNGNTVIDSGFASGYPFPIGLTQVYYTLADTFGNELYCDHTVLIKADLDPGYNYDCPDPGLHEVWADASCLAYVSLDTVTILDTCDAIDSVWHDSPAIGATNDNASGDYEIGLTTFHWYIRNYSGSVDSCEVNVMVYDTLTPSFDFCPPNAIDSLINDDCDLVSDQVQDPIISGDCSPLSLTYELILPDSTVYQDSGFASGYPFPIGTTHVYYTLADTAGNEAYCDFTVLVKDDLDPGYDYQCPDPGPHEAYADSLNCVAYVALDTLVVTDTCDAIDSVWHDSPAIGATVDDPSGDFPIGVTTFHWYVRNYSNFVASCEVTVIVYDTIAPSFTYCPPDVEDSIVTEDCYKISDIVEDPQISDDCSPLSLTYELYHEGTFLAADSGFASSYPFPVGRTQVYYTLADSAGNEVYCDHEVWIKQPNVPEGLYQCPQPVWEVDAARDSCEAYLSLDTLAILTNVCDALDSIWHNSPYGTDSMDASGLYPIGTTTFWWFISDRSGNVDSCQVDVIVNDYMPELLCPPDTIIPADWNDTVATKVELRPPTFYDNCPDSTLTWQTWGATTLSGGDTAINGINILLFPDTLNVGVTWIEYTFTDQHGNDTVCAYTVTVVAAPVIECPPDTLQYANDTCVFPYDPGVAELLEGATPVNWYWTMFNEVGGIIDQDSTIGATPFPATPNNDIGVYDFPLGTTEIQWIAINVSGSDTCSHYITVIDTTPPTIYELDSLEDCMEVIQYAIYNSAEEDLYYPDRPDHIVFEQGDTTLDLTVIDEYEDNCELSCPDSITWVIDFSAYTDQHGNNVPAQDSVYWGAGQISDYPTDMQFPGDGTYMGDIEHWVSYYATDCVGNTSMVGRRRIIVTPRPKIEKLNFY